MGVNLMSRGNRNRTIEVAQRTTAEQLAEPEVRERLTALPPGDPDMVRRPDRPSYEWPGIDELSERVAAG